MKPITSNLKSKFTAIIALVILMAFCSGCSNTLVKEPIIVMKKRVDQFIYPSPHTIYLVQIYNGDDNFWLETDQQTYDSMKIGQVIAEYQYK